MDYFADSMIFDAPSAHNRSDDTNYDLQRDIMDSISSEFNTEDLFSIEQDNFHEILENNEISYLSPIENISIPSSSSSLSVPNCHPTEDNVPLIDIVKDVSAKNNEYKLLNPIQIPDLQHNDFQNTSIESSPTSRSKTTNCLTTKYPTPSENPTKDNVPSIDKVNDVLDLKLNDQYMNTKRMKTNNGLEIVPQNQTNLTSLQSDVYNFQDQMFQCYFKSGPKKTNISSIYSSIHSIMSQKNKSIEFFRHDWIITKPPKKSLLDIFRIGEASKKLLLEFMRDVNTYKLLEEDYTFPNLTLSPDSLRRLFGYDDEFIAGEIIDDFGKFISWHININCNQNQGQRQLYVFSSHFYTTLASDSFE